MSQHRATLCPHPLVCPGGDTTATPRASRLDPFRDESAASSGVRLPRMVAGPSFGSWWHSAALAGEAWSRLWWPKFRPSLPSSAHPTAPRPLTPRQLRWLLVRPAATLGARETVSILAR